MTAPKKKRTRERNGMMDGSNADERDELAKRSKIGADALREIDVCLSTR